MRVTTCYSNTSQSTKSRVNVYTKNIAQFAPHRILLVSGRSSKYLFISYKRSDKDTATKVEQGLRSAGFDVWWDERLQTGQRWSEEIDRALLDAAAVVVLWSDQSVQSEWVRHEASIAKIRNVLAHAVIDNSEAPELFSAIQSANLSDWDGSHDEPVFLRFVEGIRSLIRRNTLRRWYRTTMISFAGFIAASVLIFGGYRLQEHLAGPQNVVTRWDVTFDHKELELNLKELRRFYDPEDWDIAVKCHEVDGIMELLSDESATFAFFAMTRDPDRESLRYRIRFHPEMADTLTLASSVGCTFAVVEKNLGLAKFSPRTERGEHHGFRWADVMAGHELSFNELSWMIESNAFAYKAKDVCECALLYDDFELEPPN